MEDASASKRQSRLGSIFAAAKDIALLKLEEKLAEEREKLEQNKKGLSSPSTDKGAEPSLETETGTEDDADRVHETKSAEETCKEDNVAEFPEPDSDNNPEEVGTLEKEDKQPSFGLILNAAKTLASRLDSTARSLGAVDDDSDTDDDEDGEMDTVDPQRVQSTNLADAKAQADKVNPSKSLFEGLAGNFMKVVSGTDKTQDDQDKTISAIVSSVCEQTESGTENEGSSIREIVDMMGKYKGKLGEVAEKVRCRFDLLSRSVCSLLFVVACFLRRI